MLNIKSVRVLNSSYSVFNELCMLSPAFPTAYAVVHTLKISLERMYSCLNCYTGLLVVGSSGLEPPTSRLSGARSNLLSYEPMYDRGDSCAFSPRRGGDDGIRTPDPLLARQVLSQLSYTPSVPSPLSLSFQ